MGRKEMKIVYVDMDSVLVNFQSGIDFLHRRNQRILNSTTNGE